MTVGSKNKSFRFFKLSLNARFIVRLILKFQNIFWVIYNLGSSDGQKCHMKEHYLNWLRLVVLIDSAGKQMCREILRKEKDFSFDDAKPYSELQNCEKTRHRQLHQHIIDPSNKMIDETQFDLADYIMLILSVFGSSYFELLHDVIERKNKIFHIEDLSECTKKFEQLWKDACNWFHANGIDEKLLSELKICDLLTIKECKGILKCF